MKLSLVVPYYESSPEKKSIIQRFLDSAKGMYDELIVVDDKIMNLARKRNKGLLKTTGDFIVLCNDDMVVNRGSLRDLYVEGKVTTPFINGRSEKLFHGHCYGIPRDVMAEVGLWDEGYDGWYYDDSDYWMQIESRGVEIQQLYTVNLLHLHPATTLSTFDNSSRLETNKKRFISRWGEDKLARVQTII